ncbi:MAG: hypothetical protein P8078_09510, partial [bacterium]
EEILNDSLRRIWENEPSRPQYKTMILKRKILGGGGITPDVFLKLPEDTISNIVRDLYYSKDRVFFTFAEKFIASHPNQLIDSFEEYLRDFDTEGLFKEFLDYINQKEINYTLNEIKENKKDISFLLKRAIANQKWGSEAGYKLTLLRDQQLKETIEYFSKAENLIEERSKNYLNVRNE